MSLFVIMLNQNKTELSFFRTKTKQFDIIEDMRIHLFEKTLCVAQSVKTIGVDIISTLNMERQLRTISKPCFFLIRTLRSVNYSISQRLIAKYWHMA